MRKALDTEELLKKIYPLSNDQPRMPLKTHRGWFVASWNPIEIFEYLEDQLYYDRMLETNALLSHDSPLPWEHNIWTLDKTWCPKTF